MRTFAGLVVAAALLASPWLPQSKALCGVCHRDKCRACQAQAASCQPCETKCCHYEKVSYTSQKTHHKLVKECLPVCKTKYERRPDPCDPCKTTKVPVTYWENKTRYRWVAYTEPVCKTKRVKVCHWFTPGGTPAEAAPAEETRADSAPGSGIAGSDNERESLQY